MSDGARQYAIVLGGGALLIAVLTVLAVIPARVRLGEAQAQLKRVESEIVHCRRRLSPLGRLDTRVRKLENELKNSHKTLSKKSELGNFLGRISRIVAGQRLADLETTPGQLVSTGNIYRMPMRLTFGGTLAGVFGFLREVEALPHYTRIDELKIENDAKYTGRLTVTLEMSVFFSRDEATKKK